jgi:N-methylhydantoinase B
MLARQSDEMELVETRTLEQATEALRETPAHALLLNVDDDGVGNGPFRVCVKVTITDDAFICDFTGSHPQVPGPVNGSRTGLHSGMRTIFKALTDPSIPANEGCFRPLKIICPDRTIFTAERPAPVSTYWETLLYVSDLVWQAMAPIVPQRLPAGHFLSVCGIVLSGNHPDTGEPFVMTEPQAGGWGAGHDKDGEDGLVCIADGETYIMPVEICETRYGLLVDQYGFGICEGGAGQHRGGRGLVRDYCITADRALYTGTFGRHKFRPWAMAGGQKARATTPGSHLLMVANLSPLARRRGSHSRRAMWPDWSLARAAVGAIPVSGRSRPCAEM